MTHIFPKTMHKQVTNIEKQNVCSFMWILFHIFAGISFMVFGILNFPFSISCFNDRWTFPNDWTHTPSTSLLHFKISFHVTIVILIFDVPWNRRFIIFKENYCILDTCKQCGWLMSSWEHVGHVTWRSEFLEFCRIWRCHR